MKVKKLQIVQISLSSSHPSSLWLSVMRKKSSHTHFVQMFNWISHNEKCIANCFSVRVLVFLVNSSSPWLVTYKTECRSRKILPYTDTVHNFKINGTGTKGSSCRVAVFSDIVQCTYSFFMGIYIDKLIGNAIC